MAQPIPFTPSKHDPRVALHARLENAPAEHAEALLSAYEVLQGLQDRGVLEFLRGALGSADKVVEIAVDGAQSPQSVRSLRNVMLLVNMIGAIDPEQLGKATRGVPLALKAATQQAQPLGLWKLFTNFLWDNDLRRGLSALTVFLQTFGSTLASPDKPQ